MAAAKAPLPPFEGGRYVSPSGATAARNYKYSGGDLSKLYKYFLSPMAQFCVDHFTPRWLA